MTTSNTLGVGLYSIVEAARLLKTSRQTVTRWAEGYSYELQSGLRTHSAVIQREEDSPLSFGDLVELMYVREFRRANVKLEVIREASRKFRTEWDTPYPLATKKFATDGRSLLLKLGGEWKNALTGQHQAFFEDIGKQLVHINNLTSEWRPLGQDHQVILSPDLSFGKPIEVLSGAHTFVLAQAMRGDQSAKEVAWWYGTTIEGVHDAVTFEDRYRAA